VRHALITIAMASFYLSSATARAPHAAAARRRVLLACGGPAGPSLLLLRLRRTIGGTPR
jgi:hypothetical protein